MRKFLISLMAATMLVPAAAQADDDGLVGAFRTQGERAERAERSERSERSSEERPQRSRSIERSSRGDTDRPAPVERRSRSEEPALAPAVEQVERPDRPARLDRSERQARRDRDSQQVAPAQPTVEATAEPPVERTRNGERRLDGLPGAFAQIGRDRADGRDDRRDNDRDWRRDGDRRDWRRDGDRRDWSRDWRRDRRYDWSGYRHRYGSLFRLGHYSDPYGWGYRRWSVGLSMWPSYYGSRYWLDDPWMYRLPPAYGPYRWVRYYDDALLVDIYTGRVVDVVHNFFW